MPVKNIFKSKKLVVYICFFLSGLSALIYEVAWLSRIQLLMGFTIYALTTTLCAYLSGLALGALLVPKIKKSGVNSLWLYLFAELIIGIYGLFFTTSLRLIEIPYSWVIGLHYPSLAGLSLIQFVFCGILIVLPTFLMGTTLPLLADYLYKEENELPIKVPVLYGINTFGAFAGCLLAGFAIIPTLGYNNSIMLAAGINFLLVLLAVITFLPSYGIKNIFSDTEITHLNKKIPLTSKDWSACFALFISGTVSMFTQLLWNRIGGLSFGSSVYIFPLITGIVLLGIVLGSFIFRKYSSNHEAAQKAFIYIPVASAVLFYMGNYIFTRSPILTLYFFHKNVPPGFAVYNIFQFLWMCVCILPASVSMGMLFPAATTILTWDKKDSARVLGIGYALNIFGLILGAIVGAFLIIPFFGIELLSAVIFAALIVTSLFLVWDHDKKIKVLAVILILGFVIPFVVPKYDWTLLTNGYFHNRKSLLPETVNEYSVVKSYAVTRDNVLLAHKDDPYATVSVHQMLLDKDKLHFKINGKIDGNNTSDLFTCKIVGFLPLFVRPDAKKILTIGLGTGATFESTLMYPRMEKTKVIEISDAVISYAKKFFSNVNGKIWKDPRATIENRDGREYLMHANEKYDVIISEPSNPWVNGVASLFTKEFFQLVSDRLTDDGVASIWMHSYELHCPSLYSVLGSIRAVFPSVVVFRIGGDYYVLAQKKAGGIKLSPIDNASKNAAAEFFKVLAQEIKKNKDDARSPYANFIKRTLKADQNDIKDVAEVINTDDDQFLQYSAGKTFFIRQLKCDEIKGVNSELTQSRYLPK